MSRDTDLYYVKGTPPETPEPQDAPEPWQTTTVVGKRLPRIDGYERVSGAATYPSDVLLPDMLYAAVLRCPHAHAVVRKVDTGRAEKMPGVVAIITDKTPGADVPWVTSQQGAMSRLFEGGVEPLEVIKWKNIFDLIEDAIDGCEDAGNTLERIVLKNG